MDIVKLVDRFKETLKLVNNTKGIIVAIIGFTIGLYLGKFMQIFL